jgi:hypothetical protein
VSASGKPLVGRPEWRSNSPTITARPDGEKGWVLPVSSDDHRRANCVQWRLALVGSVGEAMHRTRTTRLSTFNQSPQALNVRSYSFSSLIDSAPLIRSELEGWLSGLVVPRCVPCPPSPPRGRAGRGVRRRRGLPSVSDHAVTRLTSRAGRRMGLLQIPIRELAHGWFVGKGDDGAFCACVEHCLDVFE